MDTFEMKIVQDSYLGKKCYIMATGPSLAFKNLSFLKNHFVISVNLAPLTLDLFGIKPAFNVVADKLHYERFKKVHKVLTYNTPIKKIIVASACRTFPKGLIDENTFFYPNILSQDRPSFSENPIKDGFSRGKTVVYDAIQLSYYLGFSQVFIIGMDMDMNKKWGVDGHCYEIQKNMKFPQISFAKTGDYDIQRGHPGHPEYMEFTRDCLLLAKKEFDQKNRRIINDIRSKMDVFEKRDLLLEGLGVNLV